MAVVNVYENAESRSGGDSVEKGPNNLPMVTRDFTRSFVIETDNPNDGWETIKHSLPALSSLYQSGTDSDVTAKCVKRRGDQRRGAKKFWDCECDYSTESPSPNVGTEGESEEVERELRQSFRWSTSTASEALTKDIFGDAILNAAGDPFDASQDVLIETVSITRYENQSTFASFDAKGYFNSINDDAFTLDGRTMEPESVLFGGREASDVVLGAKQAKQVTYTLHIWPLSDDDPEVSKWDAFLLEHGPNHISNGAKVSATQGGFRHNVNLDAETGAKLAVGADPQFSHFKTRRRKSFSALGFRQ